MKSPSPFAVLFERSLRHGVLVAVALPDPPPLDREDDRTAAAWRAALVAHLHSAEERAFAASLGPRRVSSWVGGRVALHLACSRLGAAIETILPTPRGAPSLPEGLTGSISHKQHIAVAMVAGASPAHIGVDIEELAPRKNDITRMVLTDRERDEISPLEDAERWREVLTRFSIKEAIYKAIDPFVRRYVDFKEVETTPLPDGNARVTMMLKGGEGPLSVVANWRLEGEYVLTTARATRTE